MSDRDDLNFVWCDFSIDDGLGKAAEEDTACALETSPALRILEKHGDPVAHRHEELKSETLALSLVPIGGFLSSVSAAG